MSKFILGVLLFIPSFAMGTGISVSPQRLEFKFPLQEPSKEITVANPSAEPQFFEIFADDYESAFQIIPKNFTLQAGERQTVTVSVDGSKFNRIVSANLSIVAKPLNQNPLQINTGVKLPIAIKGSKPKSSYSDLILAAVITGGLIGYYFWDRKKQTS